MLTVSSNDYPAFYHGYVESVNQKDIFHYLEEQKSELLKFLQKLPEDKWNYSYAEGKWTVKEILGHLCDSEYIFGYRTLCLVRGEQQSLPGFDEQSYVKEGKFNEFGYQQILNTFMHARDLNLLNFHTYHPINWENKGMANGQPITAKAIPFIIAGHVRHHMRIIEERYL